MRARVCVCNHSIRNRILSEVEAIVDSIFDPDGYHKRLPMLTSTSRGIRESSSQSHTATIHCRKSSLHSKFFTVSPVVYELAAMSQVPQIRVMAGKTRLPGSSMPTRQTLLQIVPPALLTQTSRSILYVTRLSLRRGSVIYSLLQVSFGRPEGFWI
jgi:hypothetical protein